MKKSLALIITALVLSVISNINAQQKENTYSQKNPFLTDKRHGAVVITNNSSFINPGDRVYNIIPFLVEKRHGAITVVNRQSNIKLVANNLIADRNPFLIDKRHGAIVYQNANSLSAVTNPAIEQNPFLRQKRHQ